MSIYKTPENLSWCKGFTYDEYLTFHRLMDCKSTPFSKEGYEALCDVFDDEMIRNMEKNEDT